MLYWLSAFSDAVSGLDILRYISFRTAGAVITALVLVFLFGPAMIALLRSKHLASAGAIILLPLLLATLLWANLANPHVWIALGVTLGFGLIGFVGEAKRQPTFSDHARIVIAASVASVACVALVHLGRPPIATSLSLLFGKTIDLGWFYVPTEALVIVAAASIVNLADRLHGAGIGPMLIAALGFALIAYLAGNAVLAEYFNVRHVGGTGELAVLCGGAMGAGLGFLWLNAPRASTFAGQTASLALGGMLGTVAVATKHEVVLALICCLFVLTGARPNLNMNG
jgi:phospho-N-acetylmuramoyl-pentapeptide-transferase